MPALPARGALAESIAPAAGRSGCPATTAEFTAPPNVDPMSGTHASLYCDIRGSGCIPAANEVIDGESGAVVKCRVTGGGDSFAVTGSLAFGDVGFSVQGTLGAIGGKAFVSSVHSQRSLQDSQCDITIDVNQGQATPGAVWAAFDCSRFMDVSAAGNGCTATGKFIFENCDK